MTIHPDIARIARHFGTDAALVQSVMIAEGGTLDHLLKAVRCAVPSCKDTTEAIEITCRSANHALMDYTKTRDALRSGFVSFWGHRWAPLGADNDPHNLNLNWIKNVAKTWDGLLK